VDHAALAVAEEAAHLAVEFDLVDRMRRKRGDVKTILLETQMPEAFVGHRRERRHRAAAVDAEHAVVAKIDGVEQPAGVERGDVRALKSGFLRERSARAGGTDAHDRVAAAIGDEQIAAVALDRDADRPAQAARYERRRVAGAIDAGDVVAV